MQDIVFYAAANETLGVVRDYANSRNDYAPTLVLGVSVCLRMRLFAGSESAAPFPVDSFSGITSWKWRMDSDFDRETPYKLTADSNSISVQTVTDTINGETLSFTEFAIPISDMNTLELATWLGTQKKKTGLTGELVGYDSSGNAVFVLQIDDFTVRNRLAGLNEPTSNDQEYLTRSETEQLVQTEISSAAAAKQDKLTSANAGAGIAIDSGGTISMACAILGATNGVKIADSRVQFDPETAIGADGSSRGAIVMVADGLQVSGGTASIDDASVKDVLSGIVAGGTASINDEVVTPGNLRGALSFGQAVDVSCAPNAEFGSIACEDASAGFLGKMTWSVASTNSTACFGFYQGKPFPKWAGGLKYLCVCDLKNKGAISVSASICGSAAPGTSGYRILPPGVPVRMAGIQTAAFPFGFNLTIASGTSYQIEIANWRQYEVTALTDEAIAYLAQLENPDDFFRSTSTASVLNKYLVKQDMVCPWIKTISMDDNSDLTVAAGLSYKIKYTNDNAHKITVDTIPTDAYGWDAHIQMFVKGTAAVQFQPPLILMDALTPNAGHNLSVKFRNGQALVYVDDLNAGYIVLSTTCSDPSVSGELQYGLVTAPANEAEDKYIIFGSTVNGLVCDFGTVTPVYGAQSTAINLIGNGSDQTLISGTLTVPSGKNVNMQDLAVSGSTVNGAGAVNMTGVELNNVSIVGGTSSFESVVIPAGSTVECLVNGSAGCIIPKKLVLNGEWRPSAVNGDSVTPNLDIRGTGVIRGYSPAYTQERICLGNGAHVEGITVCNRNTDIGAGFSACEGDSYLVSCTITGNTASSGAGISVLYHAVCHVSNCVISDNTGSDIGLFQDSALFLSGGTFGIIHAIKDSQTSGTEVDIHIDGTVAIRGFTSSVIAVNIHIADNACLDFTVFGAMTWAGDGIKLFRLSDNVTLALQSGSTALIDACTLIVSGSTAAIGPSGELISSYNGAITVTTKRDIWRAANIIFASPLDAHEANTVRLSGTTFTGSSLISNQPRRIQLPAGSTNSIEGNTNSSDTKILQAPVMVVGDNAAAPSGSATVINAAGTSGTITGIGTYVAQNGDNDFRPVTSNFNVSNTASSGDGSLLNALTAAKTATTTSGISAYQQMQFVGFVSGGTAGVASAAADTTIVRTTILTNDYQPILGGNYTVSSGGIMTVDQTTKTATIDNQFNFNQVNVPTGAVLSGLSARTSGASASLTGGGTIKLTGGMWASAGSPAVISGCSFVGGNLLGVYDSGTSVVSCYFVSAVSTGMTNRCAHIFVTGCTMTGVSAAYGQGYNTYSYNGALNSTTMDRCVITGNTTTYNAGCGIGSKCSATITNSLISGNYKTAGGSSWGQPDMHVGVSAICYCSGGNTLGKVSVNGGTICFAGSNRLDKLDYYSNTGVVIISSGAVVDLTENTNSVTINPGGGITFGANVTIINSAGSSVLLNGGEAGTCTKINNDGTVN